MFPSKPHVPSYVKRRKRSAEPPPDVATDPLTAWNALGAELAERPHRLALALHVARAATSGGGKLTAVQEDALAERFLEIVDEGIALSGGIKPNEHTATGQRNPYAEAAWYLLHCGDWIRSAERNRPPRCPIMAAQVSCPGEDGFVDDLRATIPGYVKTVIAGADAHEIEELARVLTLGDRVLDEEYRPFGTTYEEDVPQQHMERALAQLARRFASPQEMCDAVEAWGHAFATVAADHDIPQVNRIGALVWLARVAMRTGGGAS